MVSRARPYDVSCNGIDDVQFREQALQLHMLEIGNLQLHTVYRVEKLLDHDLNTKNTKSEAVQLVSIDWSTSQCLWGHVHSWTWVQSWGGGGGGEVGSGAVHIIKLHHSKVGHFGPTACNQQHIAIVA